MKTCSVRLCGKLEEKYSALRLSDLRCLQTQHWPNETSLWIVLSLGVISLSSMD